ncbi:MAG TPA: sodium:proton exchanger [Deltaproteobacteria bacterium]|nr:sodium:proton exchanger [Deltaproteobacteria bacterium]
MEPSPTLHYLESLVLVLGVSAFLVFILGKLKIPSIVGFLVAGLLMGPSGLHIIQNPKQIESLAEIGVVLLMFAIGLEFSLKNLMTLKRLVFGAGSLQALLTIAVVGLLSYFYLGQTLNRALFDGFLISLSSTAIVLKMLLDRAEIHTSFGRSSIGMLIFQDLCVVPFMLFIPALAGHGGDGSTIAWTAAKAVMIIAAVLLAAHWAVPFLLHHVVSSRSRELFVITILVLCLGTALLTSWFGLSLALGAFLAGVVISESDYSSQAVSDILPFKESFTGLFFISIGMLLDTTVFYGHIAPIIWTVVAILLLKIFTVSISAYAVGQTFSSGIQSGFYLSQIGEFSFVLAVAGVGHGLLDNRLYNIFLSASVITMMITPFMMKVANPVATWLSSLSAIRPKKPGKRPSFEKDDGSELTDHVIIVGFGLNGRNIAGVLKESSIPYVVLDSNSSIVRKARRQKEPIFYGDGSGIEILHKVGLERARILVVVISDPTTTRRVVQTARQTNRDLQIMVRTRLVAEVDHLLSLGADEVVPEEFETSVEIFSKVLHHYAVPANIIRDRIEDVRQHGYLAFRAMQMPKKFLYERPELLKNVRIETYRIKEESGAVGSTLRGLDIRAKTGGTVIGVERAGNMVRMPPPSFEFQAGDVLFLVGMREDVHRAASYLDSLIPH